MKTTPLPRLFHAAEGGDEGYAPASEQHLLDVFDLEGQGCTAAFLDVEGRVQLCAREGGAVPKALARALAEREFAGVGRTVAAKRLWTFALDGWEPGSDVPGPDDPVHLRGRLFGPWPGPKQKLHHGTLTSSRLELLDALVRCARFSIPAVLFPSRKAPVAKAWLKLDEGFIAAAPQTLEVELEYRDTDGHLAVLGQTPRAREASSEPLELGGSFMWKKETLLLENVRLENQLEKGASLAIGFRGPGSLNVRGITVKRPR